GGFDIIITNPPWEILKPQAKEFFETHSKLVSKKRHGKVDWILEGHENTDAFAMMTCFGCRHFPVRREKRRSSIVITVFSLTICCTGMMCLPRGGSSERR